MKLAADVDSLVDCATTLWLGIADTAGAMDSLTKAPISAGHHNAVGARLFTTKLCQVHLSRANERRTCPIDGCAKELKDAAAALAHSAYHIVHSPHEVPHTEMCPLCYGPASECPPFVIKLSSNSIQPRVLCTKYAPSAKSDAPENGVKYSAASLSMSSAFSPSTNRPIVCPACNPDLAEKKHQPPSFNTNKKNKKKIRPAVWSYNMKAHWRRLHHTTAMPQGLEHDLKLSTDEMTALKIA